MTQKKTRLSDSLEDYLEIILALEKSNKVARVKDIAGEMGVLRGSVSSALKKLGEKGNTSGRSNCPGDFEAP
jgi:DtxR family Mn-dependent transcriptional regulator